LYLFPLAPERTGASKEAAGQGCRKPICKSARFRDADATDKQEPDVLLLISEQPPVEPDSAS
jgi:hypothetical protein